MTGSTDAVSSGVLFSRTVALQGADDIGKIDPGLVLRSGGECFRKIGDGNCRKPFVRGSAHPHFYFGGDAFYLGAAHQFPGWVAGGSQVR